VATNPNRLERIDASNEFRDIRGKEWADSLRASRSCPPPGRAPRSGTERVNPLMYREGKAPTRGFAPRAAPPRKTPAVPTNLKANRICSIEGGQATQSTAAPDGEP